MSPDKKGPRRHIRRGRNPEKWRLTMDIFGTINKMLAAFRPLPGPALRPGTPRRQRYDKRQRRAMNTVFSIAHNRPIQRRRLFKGHRP